MLSRAQYVARQAGLRMKQRGDRMTLRHITTVDGPEPYKNPPDVSPDLHVITGIRIGGQAYLGVQGSSVIGRLIPGDTLICRDPDTAAPTITWLVMAMPADVATDPDGIPIVAGDGTPFAGTPAIYSPDSPAAADRWNCIPVSADGDPDPATVIGNTVSLTFAADQPVYGIPMSITRAGMAGLIENDQVVIEIASYVPGIGSISPPDVNDQILMLDGKVRSVMTASPITRQNIGLIYQLRCA